MAEQVAKRKETKSHEQHGNVVAMPDMCLCQGCKKRSEKAGFCMEHFDWYKEGIITKEGRKPVDFEKKLFHFNRRKQAA
jgi:hypothetical protein